MHRRACGFNPPFIIIFSYLADSGAASFPKPCEPRTLPRTGCPLFNGQPAGPKRFRKGLDGKGLSEVQLRPGVDSISSRSSRFHRPSPWS